MVFDKTGTLTKGEPTVTSIVLLEGMDEKDVMMLAASAELGSEHPLGEAVVKKARELGIEPIRSERSSRFRAKAL